MKSIIFGANGQDGYYLSEACRKRQIEVIGLSRNGPWIHGDVSSPEIVEKLIRDHQPAIIFHIAAASTTNHDALYENNATIGTGTIIDDDKSNVPCIHGFLGGIIREQ